MFLYNTSAEFGAIMRIIFLCIFVSRVVSGPREVSRLSKFALNPSVVSTTDRSTIVVSPRLPLLCVVLWFILHCELYLVLPCVLSFFQSFLHCKSSRFRKKASLCAIRAFVCFTSIGLNLFPPPPGVND